MNGPFLSSTTVRLLLTVGAFAVLWYMFGSRLNRARTRSVAYWISDGARVLGGQPHSEWISGSAYRIQFGTSRPPLRHLRMIVSLESREIPLLWLSDLIRGKRDMLIIQADTRTKPRMEVEAFRPSGQVGQALLREVRRAGEGWTIIDEGGQGGFIVAHRGQMQAEVLARLQAILDRHGAQITRLALSKQEPQFSATIDARRLEGTLSEPLFEALRGLVQVAVGKKGAA